MSGIWPPFMDQERAARVQAEKERQLRRYNRPWWKLIRLWDRVTGR